MARTPPPLAEVRFAARKYLAAECSAFLVDADRNSERWQPYRNWFNSLGEFDTLITFNYDRVIERLDEGSDRLDVSLSGNPPAKGKIELLKLHGSVDWRFDGETLSHDDPEFAIDCDYDEELAIATPGPTKSALVRKLEPLWQRALERIRKAEKIVFLGYRFPPTDAESRRRLLEAIQESEIPYLDIQIVLSAGRDDPKVQRLRGLLGFASSETRANTQVHPMGAEDFISVYRRP